MTLRVLTIAVLCVFFASLAPAQGSQTGTIMGTITDLVSGQPVSGVGVFFYLASNGSAPVWAEVTGANGHYSVVLDTGIYKVQAIRRDAPNPNEYIKWYDNKYDFESADPVPLAQGATVNLDFQMMRPATATGTITGTIIDTLSGQPVPDVAVLFYLASNGIAPVWAVFTNPNGQYSAVLDTGIYKVQAIRRDATPAQHVVKWYNNKLDFQSADPVPLAAGATVNLDFEMRPVSPTSVGSGKDEMPTAYKLGQNYPNPFNPSTTISFALPVAGHVSLTVFDLLGREVKMLVNEELKAGSHVTTFDATDLATGVYLYRLQSGSFTETKKLMLVR